MPEGAGLLAGAARLQLPRQRVLLRQAVGGRRRLQVPGTKRAAAQRCRQKVNISFIDFL